MPYRSKAELASLEADAGPIRAARRRAGGPLTDEEILATATADTEQKRRSMAKDALMGMSHADRLAVLVRTFPEDTSLRQALESTRAWQTGIGQWEHDMGVLADRARRTGQLMLTDLPTAARISLGFYDPEDNGNSQTVIENAMDEVDPDRIITLTAVDNGRYAIVSDTLSTKGFTGAPAFSLDEAVELGMPAISEGPMVPALVGGGELGYRGEELGHGVIGLEKGRGHTTTLYLGWVMVGNRSIYFG